MPCFRTRGIGASLFKPFWWGERDVADAAAGLDAGPQPGAAVCCSGGGVGLRYDAGRPKFSAVDFQRRWQESGISPAFDRTNGNPVPLRNYACWIERSGRGLGSGFLDLT
jgi:hypothetical protein